MFFFALVFVLFTQLAVALDCAQEDTIAPLPQCASTSCPSGCEYIHSTSTNYATETIVSDGGQIIVIQSAVISNYYHCCNQSRMVSALQALETTVRAEKPDITNQSNVTQITAADAEFLCSRYCIFCSVGESHCLTVEKHNLLPAPEAKAPFIFSTLASPLKLATTILASISTLTSTLGLNSRFLVVLFISVLSTAFFGVVIFRTICIIQQYVYAAVHLRGFNTCSPVFAHSISKIEKVSGTKRQLPSPDVCMPCTDFVFYNICTDFVICTPCTDFVICTPCTDLVVYNAPSDLILYTNRNRSSSCLCTRPILLIEWHTPCTDRKPEVTESSSSPRSTPSTASIVSAVPKSTFDSGSPIFLPKHSRKTPKTKHTAVKVIQPETADIEVPEVNTIVLETHAVETIDIETDIVETAELEALKESDDTETSIGTVIIKPDVVETPTIDAPEDALTELNATRKRRVNIIDHYDSVNQDMKKTLVSQGRPSCIPFDYRSIARRAMDEAASAVYSLTGQDFVTKTTLTLQFNEEVSQQNVDILVALVKLTASVASRGIKFDAPEILFLRKKVPNILKKMEKIQEDLNFTFSDRTKDYCTKALNGRIHDPLFDPKDWLSLSWDMLMAWVAMTTDISVQDQQSKQNHGKKWSRWLRRTTKEEKVLEALLARIASSS